MLHFYTPSRQQRDNRGALQVASDDFERLWSYGMDNVSPSPNPRGGPPIRRRQATFGPQTSMGIMTPEADWPAAVRAAPSRRPTPGRRSPARARLRQRPFF